MQFLYTEMTIVLKIQFDHSHIESLFLRILMDRKYQYENDIQNNMITLCHYTFCIRVSNQIEKASMMIMIDMFNMHDNYD